MNNGYVSPENKKDSQKILAQNKGGYKHLPSAEGQKQFREPSSSDKSVTDRNHGGVKAPKFKG